MGEDTTDNRVRSSVAGKAGVGGRQFTAIIHLREGQAASPSLVDSVRRAVRGIGEINYEPKDSLLTVRFDEQLTGLADIVRTVEDCGSAVTGVAQRIEQQIRRSAASSGSPELAV